MLALLLALGAAPSVPPVARAVPRPQGQLLTIDSTLDMPDLDTSDGKCGTGPGGCTLRAAIQQANASPGLDGIIFAIPGSGTHTIAPTSELPAITDRAIVDGSTQPGF